jgi:copper chaperone CopZ
MIKKLLVLPLALAAAVSLAGPVLACGENASCTECKADTSAAPDKATPAKATAAKAQTVTTTNMVEGMKCENCVSHVNSKVSGVAGVVSAHTDLTHKTLTVTHAKGQADLGKLQAAVGKNYQLAAGKGAAAAMPAGEACAEGEACSTEHAGAAKTTAAHGACSAECKSECQEKHAPAKPSHK